MILTFGFSMLDFEDNYLKNHFRYYLCALQTIVILHLLYEALVKTPSVTL